MALNDFFRHSTLQAVNVSSNAYSDHPTNGEALHMSEIIIENNIINFVILLVMKNLLVGFFII